MSKYGDYSKYLNQATRPAADRRAKVTAQVERRDGKRVTVDFRMPRMADLWDVIARAEKLGGGVCVANKVVWPQ